jgi:hypothetical protein
MSPIGSAADRDADTSTPDLARRFEDCWSYYNAGDWAAYRRCFARDARIEQPGLDDRILDVDMMIAEAKQRRTAEGRVDLALVLHADTTVIGVVRAGNRDVVEVVSCDDHGSITRHERYYDASIARSGRLPITTPTPTQRTAVGIGSAAEKANLYATERLVDVLGQLPKAATFDDVLAANVAWSEPWFDTNLDKAGVTAYVQMLHARIENYKLELGSTWTAGDFVALRGSLEGQPRDALPTLGINAVDRKAHHRFTVPVVAIFKLDHGKVAAASLFFQTASFYRQLGVAPRTAPLQRVVP